MMFSINKKSNCDNSRKLLCFGMQMLRCCCTKCGLFAPLCGGGEQSVLKDVFWLVWLAFIKSKVSHSGMFVLKAWNKHKQSSMKSVLLLFFFFSFFLSVVFLWTQRKQDAKIQTETVTVSIYRAYTISGNGTRIPLSVYFKVFVLLFPAVGQTVFSEHSLRCCLHVFAAREKLVLEQTGFFSGLICPIAL